MFILNVWFVVLSFYFIHHRRKSLCQPARKISSQRDNKMKKQKKKKIQLLGVAIAAAATTTATATATTTTHNRNYNQPGNIYLGTGMPMTGTQNVVYLFYSHCILISFLISTNH